MSELNPVHEKTVGKLKVAQFRHPYGCRSYLVIDASGGEALIIDPHLDFVEALDRRVKDAGVTLKYIIDTHTHADHPSGARALKNRFTDAERVARAEANHAGVTLTPNDGDSLKIGESVLNVVHAPGHTPDHMALKGEGVLFTGDSLFIGSVARTDFLGGDAGVLFDSIHGIIDQADDGDVVFPGHDYQGLGDSLVKDEKANNPWLRMTDKKEFVEQLSANPPPRPANMDALLRLNREGAEFPETITAREATDLVDEQAANQIIDVRTGGEVEAEHVPGSVHVPLDKLKERLDDVLSVPVPRYVMCQSGNRANTAAQTLRELGYQGFVVIEGGSTNTVAPEERSKKANRRSPWNVKCGSSPAPWS